MKKIEPSDGTKPTRKFCPKCRKMTPTIGCPTCVICKKRYHKLCVKLDMPIVPIIWKCDNCKEAEVYQLLPNEEQNKSAHHLINTPGDSLMVIETHSKYSTESPYGEKIPSNERVNPNITLHNSFASLSISDDDGEGSEVLCDNHASDAHHHNCQNCIDTMKTFERRLNTLYEKLQSAEKKIEDMQIQHNTMQIRLTQYERKYGQLNENPRSHLQEQNIAINLPPTTNKTTSTKKIVSTKTTFEDKDQAEQVFTQIRQIPMKTSTLTTQPFYNIFLFGDQQIKGLAGHIINHRLKNNLGKHKLHAKVEPFANCTKIVESLKNYISDFRPNDKIVLAMGCNDSEIANILEPLKCILPLISSNEMYIVEVPSNSYLDVNIVNEKIVQLTNNYSNIKFITMRNCSKKTNTYYSLDDLTIKISVEMDYPNYKKQYIDNFKQLINKPIASGLKRGTIPYCFSLQQLQNEAAKQKWLKSKGTIPYYFQRNTIIAKSSSSVSNNLNNKRPKTFFRPTV